MAKSPEEDQHPEPFAAGDLLRSAAEALSRWAQAGFAVVDEPTYLRRLAACQACPDLIEPPEKLLYRMAGDGRICRHCGCLVAQKARLVSERCPAPHATEPGLSRWDETRSRER